MITKIKRYLFSLRSLARINIALSRGGVGRAARIIDPATPATWEFTGFSQNGEDGILDVLLGRLHAQNRYFVEVGTSDGLENNTTWLVVVHRYSGLWIEGDPAAARRARDLFVPLNYGLRVMQMFVTLKSIATLVNESRFTDPDLLSLDVDGNDYYFVIALLNAGLRPKIVVVEYNAAFGPEQKITVPYSDDFGVQNSPGNSLYYGCSLAGWRGTLEARGYRFVTVDQNGVNAFFVDPNTIDAAFLGAVRGLAFAESFSHAREYGGTWVEQFKRIADRPFQAIPPE